MIVTLIKWAVRIAPILNVLDTDITKAISAVESDKTLGRKLKDALEGLASVLEEIVGAIK